MRRRSLIVLLLSALMVMSPALCAFADTEAADNTGSDQQEAVAVSAEDEDLPATVEEPEANEEAVNEEPAEDASNTKAALRGGSGEGWSSDGNSYYVNGKKVTGWKEIDGDWYYFNGNGEKQTGWQKISNKWYYFDEEGCMLTGWQKINGKRYYFKPAPSGAMQTGWIKETFSYDGKTITEWYYCDSSGAQVFGWKKISNKWYYFEEDVEEGWMATGPWYITSEKKMYLFDSNGVWQGGFTGWKSEPFFDDDGVKYNIWFYFKKGVGIDGWQKINNTWYAFSDGIMMFDDLVTDSSGWYYLGSDGKISKNKWAKGYDGEWYYLGSDGHPCCNKWAKDSTDWYYLDEIGCITRNDWAKDSHGWYYMGSDGKMIKNQTLEIEGVEYTFGSDGICLNPPF